MKIGPNRDPKRQATNPELTCYKSEVLYEPLILSQNFDDAPEPASAGVAC
jgi:hypothetical protein